MKTLSIDSPCPVCHAGKLLTVNWRIMHEQAKDSEYGIMLANLHHERALKAGDIYCCQHCNERWYLDSKQRMLAHISADKLPLVSAWHDQALTLSAEQYQLLAAIENCNTLDRRQAHAIPCQVTTKDGTVYPFAEVVIQRDAPVEDYRDYQLASEIAAISASPYALPKAVRHECGWAQEIRMGFAPTLLLLSNGERVTVNGISTFINLEGVDASKTQVSELPRSMVDFPKIYHFQGKIISFIASPAPK
ncbi:hypothetical protein L9G74_05385 [Shewanella sp. C32]|uniref:Uncharacterized protein n=1 Tax=Shewanella electrica TaxID=515560 RepID=A0ABT2FHQ6_9GAMM|nr:hypothetical protein [Shewanella electrica]MCH1923962.1 hypothetical protein [Shewanella electrica]MCS4555865.1 hypothetical protein [Shewanella electrica]